MEHCETVTPPIMSLILQGQPLVGNAKAFCWDGAEEHTDLHYFSALILFIDLSSFMPGLSP